MVFIGATKALARIKTLSQDNRLSTIPVLAVLEDLAIATEATVEEEVAIDVEIRTTTEEVAVIVETGTIQRILAEATTAETTVITETTSVKTGIMVEAHPEAPLQCGSVETNSRRCTINRKALDGNRKSGTNNHQLRLCVNERRSSKIRYQASRLHRVVFQLAQLFRIKTRTSEALLVLRKALKFRQRTLPI